MPDPLSQAFAALADPTRRDIVARLCAGDATVGELAAPYDVSLQAVSKHLKVLEGAGLVSRGRTAQWRPARLESEPLHEAAAWFGDYEQFWQGTFDRLGDHLRTLTDPEGTTPS